MQGVSHCCKEIKEQKGQIAVGTNCNGVLAALDPPASFRLSDGDASARQASWHALLRAVLGGLLAESCRCRDMGRTSAMHSSREASLRRALVTGSLPCCQLAPGHALLALHGEISRDRAGHRIRSQGGRRLLSTGDRGELLVSVRQASEFTVCWCSPILLLESLYDPRKRSSS